MSLFYYYRANSCVNAVLEWWYMEWWYLNSSRLHIAHHISVQLWKFHPHTEKSKNHYPHFTPVFTTV